MYMTWEMFFQFCTIIVAIIGLIISIYNNKKDNRPAAISAVIFLID